MRAYIKAELLKNRHSEWARLMVIFPIVVQLSRQKSKLFIMN